MAVDMLALNRLAASREAMPGDAMPEATGSPLMKRLVSPVAGSTVTAMWLHTPTIDALVIGAVTMTEEVELPPGTVHDTDGRPDARTETDSLKKVLPSLTDRRHAAQSSQCTHTQGVTQPMQHVGTGECVDAPLL